MQQRNERKDAARHRELILDTASQLFHEYGVEGVSMHQIAKSAGVGQGTLYRRYSSKAELCMELLTESFNRFKNMVDDALTEVSEASGCVRLETFLSRIIDYIASEMEWLEAVKPAAWCSEERTAAFQSEPFTYITATLQRILDGAIAAGETKPFDTEFAAFSIASSFDPSIFHHFNKDKGMSFEQIKTSYINLYVGMLLR